MRPHYGGVNNVRRPPAPRVRGAFVTEHGNVDLTPDRLTLLYNKASPSETASVLLTSSKMFKSAITLAFFVAAAAAQSVIIASPIANGTLNPGEPRRDIRRGRRQTGES